MVEQAQAPALPLVEQLPLKALRVLTVAPSVTLVLGKKLGEGTYGRVYESEGSVVKVFKKAPHSSEGLLPYSVADALKEVQVAALLGRSEYIIRLLDVLCSLESSMQ